MPRILRLAAAALAVALTPQFARADAPPDVSIMVYCQPGSLNNCFAFGFQSMDGRLTYYLQNLQGSIAPGGSPFGITRILLEDRAASVDFSRFDAFGTNLRFGEVTRSGTPGPGVPVFSLEGNVRRDNNNLIIDSNGLPYLQRLYMAGSGAIYGCSTPFTDAGSGGIGADLSQRINSVAQTCIPTGLDGFLRFDATAFLFDDSGNLLRPGSFDDFYVNIAGCDVVVGALSGVSPGQRGTNCSTNIAYASLTGGFTTVPEPASLTLLATGLAGMLGSVRMRRRAAKAPPAE